MNKSHIKNKKEDEEPENFSSPTSTVTHSVYVSDTRLEKWNSPNNVQQEKSRTKWHDPALPPALTDFHQMENATLSRRAPLTVGFNVGFPL